MSDSKSNTGLLIGLGVGFGALILGIVIFIMMYAGTVNYGNRAEQGIIATYNNNRQILGTYTTKVSEMAQVPGLQAANLEKVMQAAFEGRYGENGSQAVFQMINENYPGQLDNKLYENLQATMEAGRTDFSNNQTRLIDQKREYSIALGSVFKGGLLGMAGFPKINLDDYKVVTSTQADTSFRTGIDDGVKLDIPK